MTHTNEQLQSELKDGGGGDGGGGLNLGSGDLREKVARLERENKQLRAGGGGEGGEGTYPC